MRPLAVDLDGTLIHSDVLLESFLLLIKRNPLYLLLVPFWLALTLAAMTLRLNRLPPRNIAAPHKAPALMKPRRLRPTIFSRSVDWFSSNRLTSGSLLGFGSHLNERR